MNNINFCGKREVLYGLRKAAVCARAAENYRAASFGPRPVDRSFLESANKTNLGNYLDMVCYDEAFVDTISHIEDKELKELSEILKPDIYQYGRINPLDVFKQSIKNMFKVHNKGVSIKPVSNFIKNIENKCKQM